MREGRVVVLPDAGSARTKLPIRPRLRARGDATALYVEPLWPPSLYPSPGDAIASPDRTRRLIENALVGTEIKFQSRRPYIILRGHQPNVASGGAHPGIRIHLKTVCQHTRCARFHHDIAGGHQPLLGLEKFERFGSQNNRLTRSRRAGQHAWQGLGYHIPATIKQHPHEPNQPPRCPTTSLPSAYRHESTLPPRSHGILVPPPPDRPVKTSSD